MTDVSGFHDCKQELRSLDLKVTPARIAVLEYLENTQEPVDVASVSQYLKEKHIDADQATIFRIINIFTQKGLTKQLHLNEGKFRYELSSRPEHHHLICTHCGKIQDISDCGIEELEGRIEKKTRFKIHTHSLEFFGICSDCQN